MSLSTRFYLAFAGVLGGALIVSTIWFRVGTANPVVTGLLVLALLGILWPVSHLMGRSFERRLQDAEVAVGRIGAGELEANVGSADRDAVGTLTQAIDRMARQLREQVDASRRESGDLRALFDELEEGLAFVDGDGVVTICNAAFERWSGRSAAVGEKIGTLFRAPMIADAVRQAQGGHAIAEEIALGESTVLMSARPHRSGAVLVFRDLTPLRRLEDVRRDFVANVSHELKTPLTSIVGFAEALGGGDMDPKRSEEFSDRILVNALRMRALVDDLLDLSLIESGGWSPKYESVAPGVEVSDVWAGLSGESGRGAVSMDLDDDGSVVWADVQATRQVLSNLLDNAARHADPNTAISVRVRGLGEHTRIEVHDRGPGIPSVHLERVFERFYRVDPDRSREQGGTGLGLAIVKHFVEAHGGEVGIDSELSRGTSVWFTLPSAPNSVTEPAPSATR